MEVGARLGYNHIGIILNRAGEYLRKHKKIHLAELAAELGYRSPEYFRRSIWRLIEAKFGDCIVKVEPWVYEWVCDDEG
jgi:hypothetical protein